MLKNDFLSGFYDQPFLRDYFNTLLSYPTVKRIHSGGRRKLGFVLRDGVGNGYGAQIDSALIRDLQKSDFVQSMKYVVKQA